MASTTAAPAATRTLCSDRLTTPGWWVAASSPACKAGERWPLWPHVDAFGATRVTSPRGCDKSTVTALAEEPEAEVQA
jgi:hypothetical protein